MAGQIALLVVGGHRCNVAESFVFRAGPLAPVAGPVQGLLLVAVPFGAGYYGDFPSRVLGVLLTGFLGWVVGKSMLETWRLAWPWLIQFSMDAVGYTLFEVTAE